MYRIVTLGLITFLFFSACKKSDAPEKPQPSPDCAAVLCVANWQHLLNLRLMDEKGEKNLLYGPDASIPLKDVTLYYGKMQLEWSSVDAATSDGYLTTQLNKVYASGSLQAPGDDFTLDVSLKVVTPKGERLFLLHVLNNRNCCGSYVTGIQINKTGIIYKAADESGFKPVALALAL